MYKKEIPRKENIAISQPMSNCESSGGYRNSTLLYICNWKGPFQRKLSEGCLTFHYGEFWSIFITVRWGRWQIILSTFRPGKPGWNKHLTVACFGSREPYHTAQTLQPGRRTGETGLNLPQQLLSNSLPHAIKVFNISRMSQYRPTQTESPFLLSKFSNHTPWKRELPSKG